MNISVNKIFVLASDLLLNKNNKKIEKLQDNKEIQVILVTILETEDNTGNFRA